MNCMKPFIQMPHTAIALSALDALGWKAKHCRSAPNGYEHAHAAFSSDLQRARSFDGVGRR